MTPGAQVVVAHRCPVLAAGLVTSLRRLPSCDVQLWDDRWPAGPTIEGPGAQIVIGDKTFVAALLARQARATGPGPRLVIVSDPSDDRAGEGTGLPDGVDARLTVPCAEPEFFALVRRLSGAGAPAPEGGGLSPGLLRRVLAQIEGRLGESTALADLAALAGLSKGHFSRAFKRSVGLPPHRYLLHRRIAMATRLLLDGDRSLTDIALSLGFADQSLFTRQFAALTGMTPGAARRQLRSQRDGAA
jgi:AraC-like DNA-binding protein